MTIHVRCGACGNEFDVPESFAGKQGKCPSCGHVITAPKAGVAPAAPRSKAPPVLARAKSLPEEAPARSSQVIPAPELSGLVLNKPLSPSGTSLPEKPRAPEGMPPWVWAVVGGSGLAVVGAIVAVIWSLNAPPPQVAGPNVKGNGVVAPGKKPGPVADPVRKKPGPVATAADMPQGETEWNKTKTARTIEEVTAGMVKIMFPTGGQGAILGSGFLIDKRGWVATNYHVIEKANSAIRCYMADGKDYGVAGLLAQDKERDLAIIKLSDMPFQMTILDMNNFGDPTIGTDIFCYGHPHGVDFSLSQGVVGRVCPTSKLDAGSQNFLYSSHNTPEDMVWIQVDAKINPGNSGGPLIDRKSMKVWGVNSWVNNQVGFGYASHVQYLRDLAQRCSDTPKEFPKPEKSPEFAGIAPLPDGFSAKMIEDQLANCEKFNWVPTKVDDTVALLEFSRLMHGAREIARNPQAAEKISEEENRKINAAATAAWQKLVALDWTEERVAAINKVAGKTLDKSGLGVLAVCECIAPEGQGPILKVAGSEQHILAAADAPSLFRNGAKVLVIGLSSPIVARIKSPAMKESLNVKYVKSHFTRELGTMGP